MDQILEGTESTREIIKEKFRQRFDVKIVRKDLPKKIKGAQMCLCMSLSFFSFNIAVLTMMSLSR